MADTGAKAPPVASEAHQQALQQLEKGQKLYKRGDYEGAERELLIGQQLEPMPVFNYTLGQLERLFGRCNRAIEYYAEFVKVAPPSQKAYAQMQINRCQELLAKEGHPYQSPDLHGDGAARPAETPADPSVKPAEVAPLPPAFPFAPHTPRPWSKDALGLALVGGGAAFLAAGAALTALGNPSDARSTYQHLQDARDQRWMSPTGIALLSVGGALVVGGSIRLVLVDRAERRAQRTARDRAVSPR